jgi:hypothetical protein
MPCWRRGRRLRGREEAKRRLSFDCKWPAGPDRERKDSGALEDRVPRLAHRHVTSASATTGPQATPCIRTFIYPHATAIDPVFHSLYCYAPTLHT